MKLFEYSECIYKRMNGRDPDTLHVPVTTRVVVMSHTERHCTALRVASCSYFLAAYVPPSSLLDLKYIVLALHERPKVLSDLTDRCK